MNQMVGSLFIIGAGAVGGSLAVSCARRGLRIKGLYDIDPDQALRVAKAAHTAAWDSQLPAEAAQAEIVVVAVPEPSIAQIAETAIRSGRYGTDQIWLHVSGTLPAAVLSPLRNKVRGIGSFHPAIVFAPGRITQIPRGIRFAVDGDPVALQTCALLARTLGGETVAVPAQDRPIYHAAMVVASNYLVALLDQASNMLSTTQIPPEAINPLILSLATSALERAWELGLKDALSGPIRRGDAKTVERHLQALSEMPRTQHLYRVLGHATLDLVRDRIGFSSAQIQAITESLGLKKIPAE